MNSGLVGGLGVQPLKSQRIFNTPYGSTIVTPVQANNNRPDIVPSSYNRHVDYGAFQVRDSTGQRALVLSHDNTSQRTLTLQSKTAPTGKIQWNGSDRSSAITFNTTIDADVPWNTAFYSSPTIGGSRFIASNGNGTINHFTLCDDGQTTSDVMAQRNTTNAQAFRIYNTFTSLTNYERFTVDWQTNPNTCVIGTSASSLSGVRGMEFRVGDTAVMNMSTNSVDVYRDTTFNSTATSLSSVLLTTPFLTGSNTFILANNNLSNNEPVFFSSFGGGWNYTTRLFQTYYVVNRTTNNFQLALSANGSPITFSGSVAAASTVQRSLGSPRTNWFSNGSTATVNKQVGFRAYSVPIYGASNPSTSWILKASIDGVEQDIPKIRADSTGPVTITGTAGDNRILILNQPDASLSNQAYFGIGGSNNLSWNGPFQCGSYLAITDTVGSNNTVFLRSLGANQLDISNGTSSQAFRLYNTFTSTTNYERFTVDWQTKPSTCVIGTSASSLSGTRGLDFRVGTNTVVSMASASNNLSFFTDQNNYAGGSRIMFISNATAAPTANPINGGYMFVSGGELKYRGSAGTITTLAPA